MTRLRGGGDLGHGHGHAGAAVGGQGRAGVEAEPADPQQRRADHSQYYVVRRQVLAAVAQAPAQHQRRHQGGDAGIDVDHRAAGEIQHPAEPRKPPPPDPSR